MMHSFLLAGQSNMAGRGVIGSVPAIDNPRLYVDRNARWQPMFVPVNPDRPFAGVNLAESFADAYSRDHDADVGLIPCADGGTSIEQWSPGGLLFDHAIMEAKLARRSSVLRGILWHQGENDCSKENVEVYEEKLINVLTSMRRELGLPRLPVLLGAIGDFAVNFSEGTRLYYRQINSIIMRVAQKLPDAAFVPADGLEGKPDNIHFSAPALREFGLRYYQAYKTIESPVREDEKPLDSDGAMRKSEMERL